MQLVACTLGANPFLSSLGVSPLGISPLSAAALGVSPFGVSPFGVSPFGVSPFGVSPFGVSPFGVSPFAAAPSAVSPTTALLPLAVSAASLVPFSNRIEEAFINNLVNFLIAVNPGVALSSPLVNPLAASPLAAGVSPFGAGVSPFGAGVSPFGAGVSPFGAGVSPFAFSPTTVANPFVANPLVTGLAGVTPSAFAPTAASPFVSPMISPLAGVNPLMQVGLSLLGAQLALSSLASTAAAITPTAHALSESLIAAWLGSTAAAGIPGISAVPSIAAPLRIC